MVMVTSAFRSSSRCKSRLAQWPARQDSATHSQHESHLKLCGMGMAQRLCPCNRIVAAVMFCDLSS
eukprot:5141632-Amphidinium_carterae.1